MFLDGKYQSKEEGNATRRRSKQAVWPTKPPTAHSPPCKNQGMFIRLFDPTAHSPPTSLFQFSIQN